MEILSREWYLEGRLIRYEVGQPMGAYSSFALLALTHHVIVHIAAFRAGCHPSKIIYMVLGDDGAMAHDKVAVSYRKIFSILGMEINPIKGYDGTVLEFAKQLYLVNNINLSPLGAKNIMLAMRFCEFLPTVLYELMVKRFPLFINFKVSLPKKSEKDLMMERMLSYLRPNRPYLSRSGLSSASNESVMNRFVVGADPASLGVPKNPWERVGQLTENMSGSKPLTMKTFKRQEKGSYQIPLISWESLFLLVARVYFNHGRKGKTILFSRLSLHEQNNRIDITTKIKLRVLMAIGPKGGLW